MTGTKTVVEVPIEDFNELRDSNRKILTALEQLKVIAPPDFLSRKEFMARCRIAGTTFHTLIKSGKMNYKRVGRMIYVPTTEVQRFFNGELHHK